MRIGELAIQTGVSVRSLRYYEEQGLLTAERTTAGQRVYEPDAVNRVRLLRQLYNAGLTSATIATLLPCVDTPSTEVTDATIGVMYRERERLTQQIQDLHTTRDHLTFVIDAADAYRTQQVTAVDVHVRAG